MRRWRGAGLAALAAVLLVAAGRAQVQQEPLAQTPEGTEITINCSHPTIRTTDYIHWYRQLRGRGPEFLVSFHKGSKDLPDEAGQVSVSPERRWSTLWLSGPRVGDAAVYYCALATRPEEPGLRPGTNRRGRGRGHSAGRGQQGPLLHLQDFFLKPCPAFLGPLVSKGCFPRGFPNRCPQQAQAQAPEVEGTGLVHAPPYFIKCGKLYRFMVAVLQTAFDHHISHQLSSVCKQQV
ncbi:LOW QUALITY PROTEIN: uncharacterized protein LOC127461757 [Manacus candei]|uniref:LOW QUALITY PROTEIN: uncharacterized protein LOC127461757 n=1 Tax=Manacus candei TaxID=415023 RepID=UPI00222699D4|nr:LOW QUALITY PROTEIN: uncharacterized protein LOC127461757 [Manacus candei]